MKKTLLFLLAFLVPVSFLFAEVGKDDEAFFKFWKEFKSASGITNAKKKKDLKHITKYINFPLKYKSINFGTIEEEKKYSEVEFNEDFKSASFRLTPDFDHEDFNKINLTDKQSLTSYGYTRGIALLKDGRYHVYIHQSGLNNPDGVNYIKGFIFNKINGMYKLVEVVNEQN